MRPPTRLYFLLLPLGRLFLPAIPLLFGTCIYLLWSPPSSLHALALIPLSLAKVRLSLTLTFSPSRSGALYRRLFSFFFWQRAALAYLPTALYVALRPHFPFQQAQYVQVFPLKPAPFYKLFAGLGSTNKSATPLLLSSYLTLVLSSLPFPLLHFSFYLKLFGRFDRNCLLSPPVLSGYNGSPDTRFSRGATRLMSWPDGERYLRPMQSLCSLSPLISRIDSFLFSDWRRTVSSKFS